MAINQFSHNSNEPLKVKDLNVSGSETIGNLSAGVGSITSLSGTAVTYTTGNFGSVSASAGLNVSAGGKIGVGTAIPSKALDVQGDIKLTGGIYDNVGSAGTSGQLLVSTGTGVTWSTVGNSITIDDTQLINANVYPTFANITSGIQSSAKVSSNYLVYNPFQGRVGIATTIPADTFQVGTAFTVSSAGIVKAKQYFGDGSNLSGLVPNSISTSITTIPQFIGFSTTSSGVNTSFFASPTFVFVPSGIGSLGIGTTAPTNTLHVQGDARITGGILAGAGNTTGTSGQFLQSTGSSLQWVNSSASVGVATTTSTATQFLTFVTGVGATSTLGIGTAGSLSFSPSNRTLSISSISISGLIRDAAGTWQPTDGYALKYIASNNRVEWGPVVSSVPVSGAAGVSGQVQYNNAGGFAGASLFNYDIVTGNVGIGTSTNLIQKLIVQGNVNVSGVVTANSFYGSGANLTGINTGSASGSSGQVQFNNAGVFSGASYFNYNPSTFSVGIGTSSPTGRLSIANTSTGNSLLLVNDNTSDGSLFRVNDNSGNPLFDVDAGGTISVGIGTSISLQVTGNAIITGILTARVAGTVTGAAGTSGQVQVNIGGSFTGAPYFNYDATNIRVGIGTSAPSGRLSIANTSTGNSLLLVNDNLSDGTLFRVNDNSGNSLFDVDAGGSVIFSTYGNVGIGSTLSSASSKLQVVGDVLVSGVVTATTFNGQVNAGIGTITTLIGTAVSVTSINSGTRLNVGTGGTFGTITSIGLGIGTGNPTAKLQVVGAANTSLLLVNENLSDGSLFRVADASANILFDVDANGTIIAPAATAFGIGTFTPSFPFQVGSGSTGFVVSGLGSVGIGTNNPVYTLTVASSSATATPSLSNVIADFTANTNSYSQINTRNASSGTNASTDIIATANSGSDTTNYIDLGINNSGYSVAGWTINGPLDGYLYTSDTNLSIGAAGVNKYVSLFAGGTLASNEILRANSTGVGIGTTNPTSTLQVGTAITMYGSTGIISATRYYGDGTNLTGIINNTISTPTTSATQFIGFSSVSSGVNTSFGVSTTLVFIPSSGRLGIGTTNPTTTVMIGGTLSFPNNNIKIGDNNTGCSITSGVHNFFAGSQAGQSNTTGCYNNFFGKCTGRNNTTGDGNNFLGNYAGRSNTTGYWNNFFGTGAGAQNTTGNSNNFIGRSAGYWNTTGSCNNFLGLFAGRYNTTGYSNNFLGFKGGYCNTGGSNNNFLGTYAGQFATTGSNNNFFGNSAGLANTTESDNTFFGNSAGRYFTASSNTFIGLNAGRGTSGQSIGFSNIAIGSSAGCSLTSGNYNNFFGLFAGRTNTSGTSNNFFGNCAGCGNISGSNNNFFGNLAGRSNSGSNNNFFGVAAGKYNTGSNNNFFGKCAGCTNTTGSDNTFFGNYAGQNFIANSNTFIGGCAGRGTSGQSTGSNNIAIGASAGYALTTGSNNNFFGPNAGRANTTGCYNNFFGKSAGLANTTACDNNFFGRYAGCCNTTGFNNNFFGCNAGRYITDGRHNNFFGGGAGNGTSGIPGTGIHNNFLGNTAGGCNTTGSYNNFFGRKAGFANTSGFSNNFFGRYAGAANTTGNYNNFFGRNAGCTNTTGCANNFFGCYAGLLNTTGFNNNFFGSLSGCSNTTGFNNNFFGLAAGRNNTTGSNNTFFGNGAGQFFVASSNTFIGGYAGRGASGQSTGSNNIAIGSSAGCSLTTGSNNNFFGVQAGAANTSGSYNRFFGAYAGAANTTGSSNYFSGTNAGRYNTIGNNNTYIGFDAGRSLLSAPGTGGGNIGIGTSAGARLTTGINNNFLGHCAGASNTSGGRNNFFGSSAGLGNLTGSYNNYFGFAAGQGNTTGSHNNFFGCLAGQSNTGSNNTFIGNEAGKVSSSGNDNIAIGRSALFPAVGPASNNIAIGSSAGSSATPGLVSLGGSSNTIVMGNFNHTNAYIKIAWTVTSDERDKGNITSVPLGLSFVQKLTPIEYNWIDRNTQEISDSTRRYGFSAQNILENETNPSVLIDTRDPEHLKLRESMMIPVLVNAIKELSSENRELKNRIIEIENRVGISSGG